MYFSRILTALRWAKRISFIWVRVFTVSEFMSCANSCPARIIVRANLRAFKVTKKPYLIVLHQRTALNIGFKFGNSHYFLTFSEALLLLRTDSRLKTHRNRSDNRHRNIKKIRCDDFRCRPGLSSRIFSRPWVTLWWGPIVFGADWCWDIKDYVMI